MVLPRILSIVNPLVQGQLTLCVMNRGTRADARAGRGAIDLPLRRRCIHYDCDAPVHVRDRWKSLPNIREKAASSRQFAPDAGSRCKIRCSFVALRIWLSGHS